VTFAENIPHYILQKNTQLSKQYKPNQQLKLNTIRTIMNEHQDLNIDIMKTFNIQPDDIRPGITCKKCRLLKTRYNYGSWTCTHCRYKDKKGYIRGIQDYFILFGNGISNKKARHFLQVPYKATMTRMLQRSNLVYNKKTKKWYRQ